MRKALISDDIGLLELRQYQPVDFKTGSFDEARWAALLLSASGEMSLHDLGPVSETEKLWQTLSQGYSRDTAAALYQNLFGKLEEKN